MKKLLTILLSVLICFSAIPGISVFAEETNTSTESESYTATEQEPNSTTPKSTIPGGAYVTYNLTNVISSNMQEEVWGYYETTFSPEPGYKINYIIIKHGDKYMDVIDNGDGTYTFKNEGGFTDNLTITAGAQLDTTGETSQEYSTTTDSDTQPITTTTTPKSTIPGGAYVTYNLTNVISSNMQEEVWGYYETTFSPEPGYKINYISIKYGEEEMDVTDNGDGTYTFKHEGGFSYPLSITASAQLDTTGETSQEYSTTTDSDTQPTTTEQITTSTIPKSTIPGGAYVTYNLTNVISSNMQEEVCGYYETTFSPEPGYKINYIIIKQGDKDMPVIDNGDGTYTFKNEGGFTDNLTITVKAKPFPTKLSVTNMELCVSTSDVIEVIDGTAIEWKSSNEQVATVKDGKVLGVGVGTATITVTLSSYDHLTCNVKVLDYAKQPLPTTTQKFCDAVNQYIIDSGFDEMYFVETDENGNKVMLTPDNIKSNSAIKIYLETTNFVIFNIRGVLTACSEETIEGYTFNYNTTFTNDNPCGYCVYKNNKIYSIKDAVNKGITDIRTLAYVIPGTTKDGAPVTVNKNKYVKVDSPTNFSSNKSTGCKIGNRYTTTIKMEPYKGQEFVIYDVFVIMNKDTFVTPIMVNENTAVIDIPYVTGDIEIKINAENKTYPTVGEMMGCFATNMENVSYYLCGWDSDDGYLLEDQIFTCAVYPLRYKIVPDEGYEIVSLTRKVRVFNEDTGEYKISEYPVNKTDKNEYITGIGVDEVIFEGEVRKIPAEISASQLSLKAGESKTLKVTDGTAKSWSTSNKNVATVNNGKVTAVGKGTATITATLTTGEKLTCKVTVTTSPSLTSTNISLKSGTSKPIKAVGGTVRSWTTSNKNVATVKDGKITALNKGTSTVTATLTTGKKITCKVVVATAPRLTKTTVKVKKGNTATVVISGKVATIDNKYTNTKYAKINSKVSTSVLKIKGLKKGTTTLKIKVNGVKTLSLKVTVK